MHFPLLGELYLPENWTKDKARLKRRGVPKERFMFKRKWSLALELLDKIQEKSLLAYEAVVFDAGYGEIKEFLRILHDRGEVFLAQVPESHGFWPADIRVNSKRLAKGRSRQYSEVKDESEKALSVKQWGLTLNLQGIIMANNKAWFSIKGINKSHSYSCKSSHYTSLLSTRPRLSVNHRTTWKEAI